MTKANPSHIRTVVVLGVAYGGVGATATLAKHLPESWRVVAIDRQSHANHVYPFPRFTVAPKDAAKAFMPLTNLFESGRTPGHQGNVEEKDRTGSPIPGPNANPGPHRLVHGIVTDLTRNTVTFVTSNSDGNFDDVKDDGSDAPADRVETIDYDYCVYALGGTLGSPSDVWGDLGRKQYPGRGTKLGGIAWMKRYNGVIQQAESILVVGGGALGIQFATDIKEYFSDKSVTLLHSRERLMPIYDKGLHDAVVKRCEELGITLILGERVMEWPENPEEVDGKLKTVKTDKGSELSAELVMMCTGTKPTGNLIANLDKNAIAPNGCIRIKDTLQIRTEASDVVDGVAGLGLEDKNFDNMFAVGDCADTTAIRAGHVAFAMGAVAGRNVLRLIQAEETGEEPELEIYVPDKPLIKVSLGRKRNCVATASTATESEAGVEDLNAKAMWAIPGAQSLKDDE